MMYPLLFLLIFSFSIHAQEEPLLKEAQESYEKGLEAKTLLERKKAFNQALALYLDLESTNSSTCSNSLSLALGQIFYHLGEYARAIFYDYQALELAPHNTAIRDHIYLSQHQIGIPQQIELSKLERFLSFNFYLPLPRRFYLFFWSLLTQLLLISAYIWWKQSLLKKIGWAFTALNMLLLLNLALSFYFTPLTGVLIAPTGLYRLPSMDEPQLINFPLMQGLKVEILNIQKEGEWIKIIDPQGTIGYIPASSIRLINQ